MNVDNDLSFYALMAKINADRTSYAEAMRSNDREEWKKAIKNELNAMEKNMV